LIDESLLIFDLRLLISGLPPMAEHIKDRQSPINKKSTIKDRSI
jgi:hypothetical protein